MPRCDFFSCCFPFSRLNFRFFHCVILVTVIPLVGVVLHDTVVVVVVVVVVLAVAVVGYVCCFVIVASH